MAAPGLAALVLTVAGLRCAAPETSAGAGPAAPVPQARPSLPVAAPARLRVRVVATYPHDRKAFTQGLLWHGGALFESTGLYGESSLRQVELESGRVVRQVDLPARLFGEGLARVGDRLIQLTWQEGVALVWGVADFARRGEHAYTGEGWGLCFDGGRLAMSDGSSRLVFRDPESFAAVGEIDVTVAGAPAERLNELECAGGAVYANALGSDEILRIDPADGRVTAVIDASGLLTLAERARADVLNGIAHRPESGTFLVTGKLWPKLFEVVFEPGA